MQDPQEHEELEEARARVGSTLSAKYRVDRLIGIGGMAAVFAATHLRNGDQEFRARRRRVTDPLSTQAPSSPTPGSSTSRRPPHRSTTLSPRR
jgi:hypothetical protein